MAIDPSGKGKDETAYSIMKALYGNLFLMEVGGFVDGFSELTLTKLAERATFWGVNDVVAEANYGGGMFTSLLQPKLLTAGCKAQIHDPVATVVMKESRICDTLEPLLGSHRLIVNQQVLEDDIREAQQKNTVKYSLIYQLTRMMREKGAIAHEDRLETVQMCATFFEDRVKMNANKGVERHRAKLLNQELKAWAKDIPGQSHTLGTRQRKRGRKSNIWRRKPRGM